MSTTDLRPMANFLFYFLTELLYIVFMELPGLNPSDVNVMCEPFVENAISRCTCAVCRQAVSESGGKCRNNGENVLMRLFYGTKADASLCGFSDAFNGIKLSPVVKDCRLVQDGFPNGVYTLEMGVLFRGSNFSDNASFVCEIYCDFQEGVTKLDFSPSDKISIPFSPNCTPGIYGPLCNKTCDPYCVGGVCERETGYCTNTPDCAPGVYGPACNKTCDPDCIGGVCERETGNCTKKEPPEDDHIVAITLGVGVPALVGVLSGLVWCCGRCGDVLDLISVIFPEQEVSGGSSDSKDIGDGAEEGEKRGKVGRGSVAGAAEEKGQTSSDEEMTEYTVKDVSTLSMFGVAQAMQTGKVLAEAKESGVALAEAKESEDSLTDGRLMEVFPLEA